MKTFFGSDEKLDRYIENNKDYLKSMELFYQWFQSRPKVIKKEVVQTANEMIGGDWRAYSLKEAKKKELKDKVDFIYKRTITEGKLNLEMLEKEKSKREFVKLKNEQINAQAAKLHEILDRHLKTYPNDMSQRELGCLIELIDSGTVSTPEELAEYGVGEE